MDFLVTHDRMATGCLVQPADTRAAMPGFSGPRIAQKDWESSDAMKYAVPRGKCQSTVPACCKYATLKAFMTKWMLMSGKPCPDLAFIANYQEAVNNNFRSGEQPLSAIRDLATRGALPVVPGLDEWYDSPRRIPDEAQRLRHLYRADEWEDCREADDTVSAILNMDPTNIGFHWYDTDVNPGPKGRLLVRGNRLLGGHSVLGCGVVMGYRPSPSGVGILFNNHHGDSETPAFQDERGNRLSFPVWGDDGFGVMPIERAVAGIPVYGSFALRSVMLPESALSDLPTPVFPVA